MKREKNMNDVEREMFERKLSVTTKRRWKIEYNLDDPETAYAINSPFDELMVCSPWFARNLYEKLAQEARKQLP